MGCSCSDRAVALARDAEILTNPNGDPVVLWTPPTTWAQSRGAAAVFLRAYVLVVQDAQVRIRGQKSVDGKTFSDVGSGGYIDGLTSTGLRATGAWSSQWLGLPSDFPGFFRIGLEIKGTTADTQGSVRLSAEAEFLSVPQPQDSYLERALAIPTSETTLGSVACTAPMGKLRLAVKLSADITGGTLLIRVYSGVEAATVDLQLSSSAMVSGSNPRYLTITLDNPGNFVKVTAQGSSVVGPSTLDATLALRAE